jgi:hypothetical protein
MIAATETSNRRPKMMPSTSNGSLLKADIHTKSLNSMTTVDTIENNAGDEQIPIFLYCKSRSYRNVESKLKNFKKKHKYKLIPNEKLSCDFNQVCNNQNVQYSSFVIIFKLITFFGFVCFSN